MSLTPMEWRGEPEDEAGEGERVRGVRRRLCRLVSRAVERVSGWLASHAGPDSGADLPAGTQESQRPDGVDARGGNGRARLESGPEVRQLPAPPPDSPAGANHAVEVTVEGDRLRVHEPGRGEAYITSDVYERVER